MGRIDISSPTLVADVEQRARELLAAGEIDRLIPELGIQQIKYLAAVAIVLQGELADDIVDAIWRVQQPNPLAIAASREIAHALPTSRLVKWSGRARVLQAGEECPLVARATDPARPIEERIEAASIAYARFGDDRALRMLVELGGQVPAPPLASPAIPSLAILHRVPAGTRRALDVDCGAGGIGDLLGFRQPCDVTAATIGEVEIGDVTGPFDTVLANVGRRPSALTVLARRSTDLLRPGGALVGGIVLDSGGDRPADVTTVWAMLASGGLQIDQVEPVQQLEPATYQSSDPAFLFVARNREPLPDTRRPEIWDVVPFYNELEMLEARLEELEGIADHVVVVEAERTHRGDPKALFFEQNRSRFTRWLPKIHHVVAHLPDNVDPWVREATQRDSAMPVLCSAAPEDLVLSCDVDEIVRAGAVDAILAATRSGPVRLQMRMYNYSLDWRCPVDWRHPTAMRARDIPGSLSWLRLCGIGVAVPEAGWHLTYFGTEEQVHAKLAAFAHAELDTPEQHAAVSGHMSTGTTLNGVALLRAEGDDFPEHIRRRFGPRQ